MRCNPRLRRSGSTFSHLGSTPAISRSILVKCLSTPQSPQFLGSLRTRFGLKSKSCPLHFDLFFLSAWPVTRANAHHWTFTLPKSSQCTLATSTSSHSRSRSRSRGSNSSAPSLPSTRHNNPLYSSPSSPSSPYRAFDLRMTSRSLL